MSELKARHAFDVYEEYTKTGDDEQAQVYLKSEADKVISTIRAERDEYRYNLSCARNEIHNMQIPMREYIKRIADKDKEIAELKEQYKDMDVTHTVHIAKMNAKIDKLEEDVAWNKYKRCLAMAMWCKDKVDAIQNGYIRSSIESQNGVMTTCPPDCNPKFSFYSKWHNRWLELAEQFKEAK